jgi:hypothetical protein
MNYPAGPSQEEKEIITAFCLLLNACDFCYGAHKNVCMSLGVDKKLFPQLVGEFDTAPVDGKLKQVLKYVRKPHRVERGRPDDCDHGVLQLELVQPHDPWLWHR